MADFAHRLPLTCCSPVEWLGLKIFSVTELIWFAMQTYNSFGGVMEEAVEWKTTVESPKTRMRRVVGYSLCSKASLVVNYCQDSQPVLSLSPILSSFPWVGSGNHMVARWVFCQISLQTILGVGGERGGKVSTTSASWIDLPCSRMTGSGVGNAWLVADRGTGHRTQQLGSAQATREPQPEAVVPWSLS